MAPIGKSAVANMINSRRRKSQYALLALLLICAIPLLARAFDAWHYATSDEITRSQIDTQRVVARFEQSGDAAQLRQWIVSGPSDAAATQRDLTLGEWALRHPTEFTRLVETLSAPQRAAFVESFCGSLNQGSGAPKLRAALRSNQSKAVAQIKECLAAN